MWAAKGWVNADMKPDNFGVDPLTGQWYILDVESVFRHAGSATVPVPLLCAPVCTTGYAAPELRSQQPFITATTGLFTLSVILQEAAEVSVSSMCVLLCYWCDVTACCDEWYRRCCRMMPP